MSVGWNSVIGALIATYFCSRLSVRAFAGLGGWRKLLAGHLASLAVLVLVVGLIKSYFTILAVDQGMVFVGPQLFWLLMDWVRGKTLRRA